MSRETESDKSVKSDDQSKDQLTKSIRYRVFIKYCVFPLNFLNAASSAAALVFYLPGVCTRNDIERKQSQEYILKASKKHNI